GGLGLTDAGAMESQLKLPTDPLEPAVSSATRRTCCPAVRLTADLVIVCQVCQPPVLGTLSRPVASMPSTVAWNFALLPVEATRKLKSKLPLCATLMEYSSHSPALV